MDYDGYIVCLRDENAMLYSRLPDGIEPVAPEAGLYHAQTLEDAAYFPPDSLRYIEPNYIVTLFSETETQPWNMEMIGADTAHLAGLDGSGVRIGVVDSGLYAEHEALAGVRIIPGYNYRSRNTDTSDSLGHGTFVTGVIVAAAPGAAVVPLKCFEGKNGGIADIVAAMRGGVDHYGCDIFNLSFGLSTDSQSLREAVVYAAENGVIMTAAVGNDGTGTLNYPAAYVSVIGVGMVDQNKDVAAHSQRNSSVFITAPGSGITGLGIDGPSDYRTGGGTSYACPHVAAAAALMRQAAPDMTDFQAMLIAGAEDLGEAGYDVEYGYGLLSMAAMLEATLLEPAGDGGVTRLLAVRTGLDASTRFIAASYNESGRMLDCCLLSMTATGGVLTGSGALSAANSAARVQIFYLRDGTLEPVRRPEECAWEAQP